MVFYPWFFYVATEALLVAQIDIDDGAVFGNDKHLFDDMCLTGGHGDDAAGMISTGWEADVLRCNAKLRHKSSNRGVWGYRRDSGHR